MKNVMKKQCKTFPLGGCKGLLLVALSVLIVNVFAQNADVCNGTTYTINSAMDASGASSYRWLENGQVIAGATAADYTVPSTKAVGIYTYIRQAQSTDCPDWQSSNEFTVTVFNCSFSAGTEAGTTATFVDPRDGKQYKTVVMPDGRTWFAQNLNYTKDLTFNVNAHEANGKLYTTSENGVPAIGSYWCPATQGATYSGDQNTCTIYGALYTWETAMMVDGKYSDETKKSSVWDETWITPYYAGAQLPSTNIADRNNARGGTYVKGGGRGICPRGWHIPTLREWAIMLDKVESDGTGTTYLNSAIDNTYKGDAGKKLKSAGASTSSMDGNWNNNFGTDYIGFAVRPAGYVFGSFLQANVYAFIHASTVQNSNRDYAVSMHSSMDGVALFSWFRNRGMPTRCLKD